MIITIILGILAGLGARRFQSEITELVVRYTEEDSRPPASERRVAGFAVALFIAAAIAALLGEGGRAPILILAATAAYFQKEVREAILARRG